jgi:hypothetical protein
MKKGEDKAMLNYLAAMSIRQQKSFLRDCYTQGITLYVYAGADEDRLRDLGGKYIMRGLYDDRPYFKRVHPIRKYPACLFWMAGSGWWFGHEPGGELVYAYEEGCDNVSVLPLQNQWRSCRSGECCGETFTVLLE